jgi:hypothetical protein
MDLSAEAFILGSSSIETIWEESVANALKTLPVKYNLVNTSQTNQHNRTQPFLTHTHSHTAFI